MMLTAITLLATGALAWKAGDRVQLAKNHKGTSIELNATLVQKEPTGTMNQSGIDVGGLWRIRWGFSGEAGHYAERHLKPAFRRGERVKVPANVQGRVTQVTGNLVTFYRGPKEWEPHFERWLVKLPKECDTGQAIYDLRVLERPAVFTLLSENAIWLGLGVGAFWLTWHMIMDPSALMGWLSCFMCCGTVGTGLYLWKDEINAKLWTQPPAAPPARPPPPQNQPVRGQPEQSQQHAGGIPWWFWLIVAISAVCCMGVFIYFMWLNEKGSQDETPKQRGRKRW